MNNEEYMKIQQYRMLLNSTYGAYGNFALDNDYYMYALNQIKEIIESTNDIKDKPILKKMIKYPLL